MSHDPHTQPDQAVVQLSLAELLAAFSYAIDLTEGQPPGHILRGCWIGFHIGKQYGLNRDQLWELYYTLMLKDVGCSSNAARMCQLFFTDDLALKRDFKTQDGSMPEMLRFVLSHAGLGNNLAGRFSALIELARHRKTLARELIDARCQTGARIVRQLRFPQPVIDGVHYLDEHWDGRGQPDGLAGEQIPLYARIALLAQVIDVFYTANGPDAARAECRRRAGNWFDPALVKAFEKAAEDPHLWQVLASDNLSEWVVPLVPADKRSQVDEDYLDDIAAAFAGVVDTKSSFTAGHSERVAIFTDLIATEMGLSASHRRRLRRAALLHDIGKLGISNAILDKPGKLSEAEFDTIKSHPVHSANILTRVPALRDLVPVARGHHERLDGKGYPDGLQAGQIGLDTRIVTVADVFDALTAHRPYRDAMPIVQAYAVMDREVDTAFDRDCLEALKRAIASLNKPVKSEAA